MKSIQNQYNQLVEGNLSQANFMRAVRMTFPQYVTNVTSFTDSVKILKNKGILSEVLNEALNKDIKAFGQDLDKRFKEAGFDTLITMQSATPEQLNIIKTNPKAVLFSVYQNSGIQALYLYVNPSQSKKAESIIDRFQLSNYSGPVLRRGWTAKQVQGAINPGEIVKDSNNANRGEWYFYRLANVNTKVANVTEGKKQEFIANPVELTMGIKVEMEHTGDVKKAAKIAIDHLKENPSYYSQLRLSGIDSHQERPKAKAKSVKAPKKGELVDKENGMKVVKENLDWANKVYGGTGQNMGDTGSSIEFKIIDNTPEYFEIDYVIIPNSRYRQSGAGSRTPREKEYGTARIEKNPIIQGGYIRVKGDSYYVGKEFVKNIQETKLNMFPGEEPNDTVKQAAKFIEMNNTLNPYSNKFILQNIGRHSDRAVLRYGYWEKLPSTLLEKFKLQFNVEEDVEEHDDRLPTTAYILTPLRPIGKVDVGAAFDKFKATLENIVREVLEEENSK
jgi:hypothetical protein